ncbi:RTA1-domain-containing protein [Hypoxylon rubiginosum]|uniref:RTA1-domain-containing protein n=1 Tax=Hypoxylon rubiginosum TaxID=110542 RepID=A0ACB9YK54_9PEZI|nr:RTA1-domain-containing protein [Hypoxylon rubiginosum]
MPLPKGNVSFYRYDPFEAVAAVSCALFGVTFLWSTFMTIQKRAWVWIVQLVAIFMEVLGYADRIKSAGDPTNLNLYAVQFCVIILAPVLMAAAIYVVFGRIVVHVVPAQQRTMRLLWVPPRWITPIFVACDVVALVVQLIGAVMVSSTQATDKNAAKKLNTGKNMALAGLAIQIAAFGLFTIVAARFHFTSRQFVTNLQSRYEDAGSGGTVSVKGSPRKINPNWRRLLYAINISCVLVLIRSAFRVVEFAEGTDGAVMRQEWFMYVFDTLPIFLVACSLCFTFPGSYIPHMGFRVPKQPSDARELASQDGSIVGLREV